ncbi:MAG TPA: NUDIX domain-containing protein, partial [Gemmatimonadales bacterium]|nr:NUDIX domain-containing protein [Gemmatimonadales bacterium]
MTDIRVDVIDAYVLRPGASGLEVLVLRRAPGGRSPGSWETVHGHIEPGETPVQAALRELREETGLEPARLYNLSRVEAFYRHRTNDIVLIPVFAGVMDARAAVRHSAEHDRAEWLTPPDATARFSWPRERRALDDVLSILGSGDAG